MDMPYNRSYEEAGYENRLAAMMKQLENDEVVPEGVIRRRLRC